MSILRKLAMKISGNSTEADSSIGYASLSRQAADQAKEEFKEDTKDLPWRVDIRERYKEAIEDTLRRFNQKVEEEGKSPEQAMKEIRRERESRPVKDELNALLSETATIGHEGEWNEEFGKSDHTGNWYANVEFPDGHLDSDTVDRTREAGWLIVNAYRYGDECLVVRFEKGGSSEDSEPSTFTLKETDYYTGDGG